MIPFINIIIIYDVHVLQVYIVLKRKISENLKKKKRKSNFIREFEEKTQKNTESE